MGRLKPKGGKLLFPLCRNALVACVVALNCLFAPSAWAHDYDALPPEEIALPDSFVEFRSKLKSALDARDVATVRSFLAENVRFGFGGSSGPDAFIAELGLAEPNSDGWGLLSDLISTDAAKIDLDQTEAYMLPYTSDTWPENADPDSIVIGNAKTKLRTLPSAEGRIASILKYPILHVKSEMKNGAWLEVEASNGLWGYIPEGETASFLGYRMLIENRTDNDQAKWRISFVGAGD